MTAHFEAQSFEEIPESRYKAGRGLILGATIAFLALLLVQALYAFRATGFGFANWRPVLYSYVLWSIALGAGMVMTRGEGGKRALFILPAVLFTVGFVVFPTLFGFYLAFTDWNLSSIEGRKFNGIDNLVQLWSDRFYWNALGNMIVYCLSVIAQYAIAFGLAMLLNAEIRARKFFRVAFLLPFMLSPVAVSWMIGKSMLEYRFGPIPRLARWLGVESPNFLADPAYAIFTIMAMDAWMWIPFMMILLLAGLQALPQEVREAAKVDGASGWQGFWQITFPLMLPVSITTVILRIIFELKLADIVINVTAGGPGGATDTVSSFIFREYRERANVGYGTTLAQFYLVLIILFISLLLWGANRFMQRWTGAR
jgi:multiple sugar transport system permease protein